jgi:hypothetical protein
VIRVPDEFETIQSAVAESDDGDTVLVSPGIYFENVRFLGRRILLTSYLGDRRGSRSTAETIIDGSYPTNPDSSAVVYFVEGEDSTSVIRGFTLTHGAGKDAADGRVNGPGIWCEMGSPTIVDNHIIANSGSGIRYRDEAGKRLHVLDNEIRLNASPDYGGGIQIKAGASPGGSSALIESNLILGNSANYGGALSVRFGQSNSVILRGNTVSENSSPHGAGVWSDKGHTNLRLERNVIAENAGAAVIVADYDPGSHVVVLNNTISGNEDGLAIESARVAEITNNIVTDNGFGISISFVYNYTISYNDVYGNAGGDYVGCEPGIGDISADPMFVGGVPFDYHLTALSPCIDAGDPNSPPDPDGTRADMGAFYFDQNTGVLEEPAAIAGPSGTAIHAWPNPFGDTICLTVSLRDEQCIPAMSVYDACGRLVRALRCDLSGRGSIDVHWDGRTETGQVAPSGVYFLRVGGEQTYRRSIVRLK